MFLYLLVGIIGIVLLWVTGVYCYRKGWWKQDQDITKLRYRLIVENIPSIFWVGEVDGSISYVNKTLPPADENKSYTLMEWLEKRSSDVHKDDIGTLRKVNRNLFNEGTSYNVRFRTKNHEGGWNWMQAVATLVIDPDGKQRAYGEVFPISDIVDNDRRLVEANELLKVANEKLRQDEKQLRERELLHRTLFMSAVEGIFLIRGLTYIQCNDRAAEIFGYDAPEALIGKSPTDFSPEYQADGRRSEDVVRERIGQAFAGIPQVFEWIHTKHNNALFYAEIKLNRITLNDEALVFAIVRDISERKKNEKQMAYRDEFNRLLLEISKRFINVSPDAVREEITAALQEIGIFTKVDKCTAWVFNEDYSLARNIAFWIGNQTEDDSKLYEKELSIGKLPFVVSKWKNGESFVASDTDMTFPDEIEARKVITTFGFRSIIAVPFTEYERLKGFVTISYTNEVHTWDEETMMLLKILADIVGNLITRSEMSAALRESEARVRQIAENIEEVFFLIERPIFNVLYVSPGIEDIAGISVTQIIDNPQTFFDCVHPEDIQILTAMDIALQHKQSDSGMFRLIRSDGSLRWLRARLFHVTDAQGNSSRFAGVIADITEQKNAQETARNQEQLLIQADKMSSLGLLVSGVAHEINNPNNLIMLNTDVVKMFWKTIRMLLSDAIRDRSDIKIAELPAMEALEKFDLLINGITEGSMRIKRIVQNLKDFARVDSHDSEEPIAFSKVVESAVTIIHSMVEQATTNFIVDIQDDVPHIKGCFQKLEQVVINLLSNSCHAIDDNSKGIAIKLFHDKIHGQVVCEVSDEGRGIPQEFLPKIFDPFFTTKRTMGGTGLGLSVSYSIIKEHGGRMECESEIGRGTVMRIILPQFPNLTIN